MIASTVSSALCYVDLSPFDVFISRLAICIWCNRHVVVTEGVGGGDPHTLTLRGSKKGCLGAEVQKVKDNLGKYS